MAFRVCLHTGPNTSQPRTPGNDGQGEQGHPLLPVCQLLLKVPTLAQELSTGGYDPKQNTEHIKLKHSLACRRLQDKHSLIHKNSNYSFWWHWVLTLPPRSVSWNVMSVRGECRFLLLKPSVRLTLLPWTTILPSALSSSFTVPKYQVLTKKIG